jgi:hypothetical protein
MFIVLSHLVEGAPESTRRFIPRFSSMPRPPSVEELTAAATTDLQQAQLFALVPVHWAEETLLRFQPPLPAGLRDWQPMAVQLWV